MAPRETENNAYAKFWGDKHYGMLWYFWSGQLVYTNGECDSWTKFTSPEFGTS